MTIPPVKGNCPQMLSIKFYHRQDRHLASFVLGEKRLSRGGDRRFFPKQLFFWFNNYKFQRLQFFNNA